MGLVQAFRVDESTFYYICRLVKPQLEREGSNYQEPLSVQHQVAIGLYKMAHGVKYTPLMHQFGVGRATAQKVCVDFNRAVWALKVDIIGWRDKRATLAAFRRKGFPGCLGAIDGCHIPIQKPAGAGATYRCYKGFNSLILSRVVDENRRFCDVDIGMPGINHDAHVYRTSDFFELARRNFGFDPAACVRLEVGGVSHRVKPYVIGDPAYPLSERLIKGWPGSKCARYKECAWFTYRLSGRRMKVEQAYGMVKSRWQNVSTPHKADIRNHVEAIGAACVLHNICIDRMGKRGIAQECLLREDPVVEQLPDIRAPHGWA
jgi:hypothetical protein